MARSRAAVVCEEAPGQENRPVRCRARGGRNASDPEFENAPALLVAGGDHAADEVSSAGSCCFLPDSFDHFLDFRFSQPEESHRLASALRPLLPVAGVFRFRRSCFCAPGNKMRGGPI